MAARKRIDPVSRPVDRPSHEFVLNRDPKRHYVWVSATAEMFGVNEYTSLGYDIELTRPGGPRGATGKAVSEGQPVPGFHGTVLMSCPVEDWQDRHDRGQAQVTQVEQKILKPGGVDGLRGFRSGGGTVAFENETSAAFQEGA
jgi:hypothetical protein